jgi:ArsR family transcriptional regulator
MANHRNDTLSVALPALKALADETRLRAVLALGGGELCVCQLIALLRLAPSTVSKHLSILKQAGLVTARKEGRWNYYRLAEAGTAADPAPAAALEFVVRLVGDAPRIEADRRELDRLLALSVEEVCRIALPKSDCCSSAPETPAAARWRRDGPGGSSPA